MDRTETAEEELTDESRYRLLVEAVTDYAIYMLDPSGIVTSWNPGAQRAKGYAADEIIGQHFSRFYTDADRHSQLPEKALRLAAEEGKFESEGWRVRSDGSRFWAHVVIDPVRSASGKLIGYAKTTRDLSERKAAQEALTRSEEQFRLLVQGVSDYAIYMLDPGGHVVSWNAGAERIKGYTEEEVIGSHFSRFYRTEDQGQPAKALNTAVREGRFEGEGWRVRKDGTHFWANVIIDAIRDERGHIIGFAKITRDVTAKRDAQIALQSAQESLFQAQKLDAIGQLTGGVAHDFNNLLTVILSSLEMMRRHLQDDPRMVRLIANAYEAARRGASLTQRMLSFARRQDLKPVSVDVIELAQGLTELMRTSIGPTIAIEVVPHPGLARVFVDVNQLELALLNLVVNARDAMHDGGRITIAASDEPEAPEALGLSGAFVRLSVTDTGEGMDEETLLRASEPFFTTKGIGKGTGMGLSMVDGLASQSGGRFVLKSRKGIGTTAELWLPVASAIHPKVEDAPAAPGEPAGYRPLRVVAVDDDSLVLTNTIAMLEELGHSVRGANSAGEGLALFAADAGVDLLLTDHAMPQMTGAELIERLRHARPDVAVILASGYAELTSRMPSAVISLGKPFGLDGLRAAIGAAMTARGRSGIGRPASGETRPAA